MKGFWARVLLVNFILRLSLTIDLQLSWLIRSRILASRRKQDKIMWQLCKSSDWILSRSQSPLDYQGWTKSWKSTWVKSHAHQSSIPNHTVTWNCFNVWGSNLQPAYRLQQRGTTSNGAWQKKSFQGSRRQSKALWGSLIIGLIRVTFITASSWNCCRITARSLAPLMKVSSWPRKA